MADYYVNSAVGGGDNSGSNWANAALTLNALTSIKTAADRIFIGHTHAETAGAAKAITFPATPGMQIFGCTINATTEPPTAADLVTAVPPTAPTITTTGNFAVTFVSGCAYIWGVKFNSGTGAVGSADLIFGSATGRSEMVLDNCSFNIPSTSNSAPFQFGIASGSNSGTVRDYFFNNCEFTAGWNAAITAALVFGTGTFRFNKCTYASASSTPTAFVGGFAAANPAFIVEFTNCDLTGTMAAATNLVSATLMTGPLCRGTFKNCKVAAPVPTGTLSGNGVILEFWNCANADTHYTFRRDTVQGTLTHDAAIYRTTGGATDASGVQYSIAMSPGAANTLVQDPMRTPDIAVYNTSTSAQTATVQVQSDSTLSDAECWLEIDYQGTTNSPLGVRANDRVATLLTAGTNRTDNNEPWTGTAKTYQYALSVSFTATDPGYVVGKVMLAADKDIWIDPKITLA